MSTNVMIDSAGLDMRVKQIIHISFISLSSCCRLNQNLCYSSVFLQCASTSQSGLSGSQAIEICVTA